MEEAAHLRLPTHHHHVSGRGSCAAEQRAVRAVSRRALETRSSLRAYMALPFDGVDTAWIHFWRLYLCSITHPAETIDLRRLMLHLTNTKTVHAMRLSAIQNKNDGKDENGWTTSAPRDWGGGMSRISDELFCAESNNGLVADLRNPKALGVNAVKHLGKWALNETALMLEMIMSVGAVTGVRIGGSANKKESERYFVNSTSPFMGREPFFRQMQTSHIWTYAPHFALTGSLVARLGCIVTQISGYYQRWDGMSGKIRFGCGWDPC